MFPVILSVFQSGPLIHPSNDVDEVRVARIKESSRLLWWCRVWPRRGGGLVLRAVIGGRWVPITASPVMPPAVIPTGGLCIRRSLLWLWGPMCRGAKTSSTAVGVPSITSGIRVLIILCGRVGGCMLRSSGVPMGPAYLASTAPSSTVGRRPSHK